MHFRIPIIACLKLTPLYINCTTNIFLQVVKIRILDIMLPVININQLILSIYRCFACLLFNATSLLRESILVDSLVYFLSMHLRFANLFQLILLSVYLEHTSSLCWFISVKPSPRQPSLHRSRHQIYLFQQRVESYCTNGTDNQEVVIHSL